MSSFFLEILPKEQQNLLKIFCKCNWLSEFYLAGGTSLALQIGHRVSIDFDFFSKKDIDINNLKNNLMKLDGSLEIIDESNNTLYCILNNVKLSFISYKYLILADFVKLEKIKLISFRDIYCMKLSAICNRGNKKDFIDIFYLLKKTPLKDMLKDFRLKYGKTAINKYSILKSLLYFDDAEHQPMPIMQNSISWKKIKQEIIETVKSFDDLFS